MIHSSWEIILEKFNPIKYRNFHNISKNTYLTLGWRCVCFVAQSCARYKLNIQKSAVFLHMLPRCGVRSCSVTSDSATLQGSSIRGKDKNTGVGFHFLLQGILSASPVSPALQADSLLSEPLGRCFVVLSYSKKAFIFLFEYERTPYFHNRSEFLLILMWSLSLCNSNTLVPAFTYGTIQVVLFYFYMTFL